MNLSKDFILYIFLLFCWNSRVYASSSNTSCECTKSSENELSSKVKSGQVDIKELSFKMCKNYLNEGWKNVTPQTIGFKPISGGLSNLLYRVSLPENLANNTKKAPKDVLLRIYGQTQGKGALEMIISGNVIYTLLSERGFGPKLYGVFPGGRLEEFILGRALFVRELADEKLSKQIAQKMAFIHSLEMPLQKEPGFLWETIERWLVTSETILQGNVPDVGKSLIDIDYRKELAWLKKKVEESNCPVTFCHNDIQEGNILLENQDDKKKITGDPKIIVIDYEYCAYNYRTFDIANHFIEWAYDYTVESKPYFGEDWKKYPSEKQRLTFINNYLKETKSKESAKKIMKEVELFSLTSHFLWGLWSIVNAEASKIEFGYWEYGVSRFNAYTRDKKKVI